MKVFGEISIFLGVQVFVEENSFVLVNSPTVTWVGSLKISPTISILFSKSFIFYL
jgi:hypothetical protein